MQFIRPCLIKKGPFVTSVSAYRSASPTVGDALSDNVTQITIGPSRNDICRWYILIHLYFFLFFFFIIWAGSNHGHCFNSTLKTKAVPVTWVPRYPQCDDLYRGSDPYFVCKNFLSRNHRRRKNFFLVRRYSIFESVTSDFFPWLLFVPNVVPS